MPLCHAVFRDPEGKTHGVYTFHHLPRLFTRTLRQNSLRVLTPRAAEVGCEPGRKVGAALMRA